MKLQKRFNGLRQNLNNWFGKTVMEFVVRLPLNSDPCVEIYEDGSGFVIPALYVDDIMTLEANETFLNKLKK